MGDTITTMQPELPGLQEKKDAPMNPDILTDRVYKNTPTNLGNSLEEEKGYEPDLPYEEIIEEESPHTILDRTKSEVVQFCIDARKKLYYYLEERASENGHRDAFGAKVKDIQNFIEITNAFPRADPRNEEEKKNDPYYSYPLTYTKGLKTYIEEIVETGGGYEYLVRKIISQVPGGKDQENWEIRNPDFERS